MSLDKLIQHGKEHRNQYTDGRLIFGSERNHGKDWIARSNRTHKNDKRELLAKQQLEEL